jgi:Dockerin type I domain
MRRLFMQSLECRCVMDASGFEMGTEVFQNIDLESSAIFQSVPMEIVDETSTDNQTDGTPTDNQIDRTSTDKELVEDTLDPDSVMVICDLPTIDLNKSETADDPTSDVDTVVDETVTAVDAGVLDETTFRTFDAPSQDDGDLVETTDLQAITPFSFGPSSAEHETIFRAFGDPSQDDSDLVETTDLQEVAFSIDDLDTKTLVSFGPSSAEHETTFLAFGATTQADAPLVISPAIRPVRFNFDVDQSGSLSRLDAEKLISYLSNFFRSENFSVFAESNSSDMLQMDVDGDAQLTPLDALIVINELNRTGTLESNVSTGASNSTLVASGDLRIRNIQDDLGDAAAPIEEIGASVGDSTDVLGKRLIAPMRMSYKSIPLAKEDGTAFVLSVDDNGKVSAVSDTQDLVISVDEDQVISVDGESTGLAVVDFGGVLLLSAQAQADSGFIFA